MSTKLGIVNLAELSERLKAELDKIESFNDFNLKKSEYLGKTGIISKLFNEAKDSGDFKDNAKLINEYRAEWNLTFKNKQVQLQAYLEQEKLKQDAIDVTRPGYSLSSGSLHPVTLVKQRIMRILYPLGYREAFGPEVEDDFHNFEALNVAEYHPARGMQDTFYLLDGSLLRTQTSSVQIHELKNNNMPLKIISAGRVYRRDSDQTHTPMFHQLEMLTVDKECNFSDLKAVLVYTFRELFGHDLKFRFRPSYFPFTEPSGELDIEWNGNWLEVAGYGMVHPNVLSKQGISTTEYSGCAFGVGLDRLAMLLFGINDLRLLFQNDVRFLQQFSGE